MVPNIASTAKRAPGISKGLWKKELMRQLTGKEQKKERRGMRTKEPKKEKRDKEAATGDKTKMLGKRKSSTLHKTNTSTFKSQKKPRN